MDQVMVINGKQVRIELERDAINVTPISEPDLDWEYIDSRGHVHRWSKEGESYCLPTLKYVNDSQFNDKDEYGDDEYNPTHYECIQCKELVSPGYRPVYINRYVLGPLKVRVYTDDNLVCDPEEKQCILQYLASHIEGYAEIILNKGVI